LTPFFSRLKADQWRRLSGLTTTQGFTDARRHPQPLWAWLTGREDALEPIAESIVPMPPPREDPPVPPWRGRWQQQQQVVQEEVAVKEDDEADVDVLRSPRGVA
jgi:hypothetical protein